MRHHMIRFTIFERGAGGSRKRGCKAPLQGNCPRKWVRREINRLEGGCPDHWLAQLIRSLEWAVAPSCYQPASDILSRQGQEDLGQQEKQQRGLLPHPFPMGDTPLPMGQRAGHLGYHLRLQWLVLGSLVIVKLFQSSQGREERRGGAGLGFLPSV